MRRLVLWCMLGLGASACTPEEPPVEPEPSQEQPLCPDLVVEDLRQDPSTLSSDPTAAAQPVLVRYRKSVGSLAVSRDREEQLGRLGGRVTSLWPSLDALAVSLTPEAQARLAQDPDVLSISPDKEVRALGTPWVPTSALPQANPSGSTSEYTLALTITQAPQVWDANLDGVLDEGRPTGQGIRVCVIDSGIDPRNAEFGSAYVLGKDFVDKDDVPEDRDADGNWGGGHGTHVAGTIAAQLGLHGRVNPSDSALSPQGMVGVAPGVELLVARVLNTKGSGSVSKVLDAAQWCADNGAKILSLSLGSPTPDETERALFKKLWEAGILSVAASGNGGDRAGPEDRVYPAGYEEHVVAVGAVEDDETHPVFSQGGPHLSLVAPGVNVYSTFIVGRAPYGQLSASGTPFVTNALEYANFGEYEGTLLNCGLGKGLRSCPVESTCGGFVAYVDRGDITFSEKVRNVRSQGASAVIVGNSREKASEDKSLGFTLTTAANWPPVVAVRSTDVATLLAQVGRPVRVTVQGADYSYSTGTSMATPHVSGVAALVWSARKDLTNIQVRGYLESSAKRLLDPTNPDTAADKDIVFGWGLVQAKAAVDKALADKPM